MNYGGIKIFNRCEGRDASCRRCFNAVQKGDIRYQSLEVRWKIQVCELERVKGKETKFES